MSDTNLSNSFQKVTSSNLQNVNQAVKSIFTFPKVKDQLTSVCNQLDSANYFESTAASIKKEIQSWKEYNAAIHSPAENMSFSRSVASSLKTYLQSDKNHAEREIDDIQSERRESRRGMNTLIAVGGVLSLFGSPMGTPILNEVLTMNRRRRSRGGDISSLEEMIRNNRRYIDQLDAILRLYSVVCDYQFSITSFELNDSNTPATSSKTISRPLLSIHYRFVQHDTAGISH